jgi:hypothetical protein
LGDDKLDRDNFESLADTAKCSAARGETEKCLDAATAALDLWRGPALTDVASTSRTVIEARRLNERRAFVEEIRIEAKLAAGWHAELVDELSAMTLAHPTHERLREHLMRALHALGRRAEALEVYREGRRALIDGLGIEPGNTLRQLEQQVLNDELAVLPSPRQRMRLTHRSDAVAIPRQLPSDITDFAGRDREIDQLIEVLAGTSTAGANGLRIVAVSGRPGVGKTALAVRVAHRLQSVYPDGQIYVELGGSDRASTTSQSLLRILRALGLDAADIPPSVAERAEMFRSLTADSRLLVVLDDAASEMQVRTLLPGSSKSAVLISSRRILTGLEGTVQLTCGVLDEDAGLIMLRNIAGSQRIARDLRSSLELVRRCRGLPLALRVVGAKLAARPYLSPAQLVCRLSKGNLLDELRLGELDVRSKIASGYQRLGSIERQLLDRLVASGRWMFRTDDLVDVLDDVMTSKDTMSGDDVSDDSALDTLADSHILAVRHALNPSETRFCLDHFDRLFVQEVLGGHDHDGHGVAERSRGATSLCRPAEDGLQREDEWP